MTNEELRRAANRSKGRGMKMSVRVNDLARVLDELAAAEERARAAAEAPPAAPPKGRVKALSDQVETLGSTVRYLAALVEESGGLGAVDALSSWGETNVIDVSSEIDALDRALSATV